jgi:hypothetical protein
MDCPMSLDTPTSIEHPINGPSHMSFHPLHPPWFLRGVTLGGKPRWIVSLGERFKVISHVV